MKCWEVQKKSKIVGGGRSRIYRVFFHPHDGALCSPYLEQPVFPINNTARKQQKTLKSSILPNEKCSPNQTNRPSESAKAATRGDYIPKYTQYTLTHKTNPTRADRLKPPISNPWEPELRDPLPDPDPPGPPPTPSPTSLPEFGRLPPNGIPPLIRYPIPAKIYLNPGPKAPYV